MLHASRLAALALAVAFGSAAIAEEPSGKAGDSGEAGAAAAAPAGTEIKGVYSTKRMMGISTGSSAGAGAQGAGEKSREEDKPGEGASD